MTTENKESKQKEMVLINNTFDLYAVQEWDELNKIPYVEIIHIKDDFRFALIRINGKLKKAFSRPIIEDEKGNLVAIL